MTDKLRLPTHYTGQPSGYYEKSGANYNDVHDAEEADWVVPPYQYHGVRHTQSTFYIYRALFTVDLTDFPTDVNLTQIYLKSPTSTLVSTSKDIYVTIVDGRDIYGESGAFGIFEERTESLGQMCIPAGTPYDTYSVRIPFNATGWELLESCAGGSLTLGMRIDQDIEGVAPSASEAQDFWFYTSDASYSQGRSYLWVEYNATPGYIWVDRPHMLGIAGLGTKFAYIDTNCAKRTKEGTPTGVTGEKPGYIGVSGIYLEYSDYSDPTWGQNVCRRIEGNLTGLTGKLPNQISVNTKAPMLGTHHCYIDEDGNERCFEGTIG